MLPVFIPEAIRYQVQRVVTVAAALKVGRGAA
jgi:hypothetical protein